MRLEGILQAQPLATGVALIARAPANDNLTFAERVEADIAEAARAAGVCYSPRELSALAADALAFVSRLRLGR